MLQSCGCRMFPFLSDLLRWFGQGLPTTAVRPTPSCLSGDYADHRVRIRFQPGLDVIGRSFYLQIS